MANGNLEVGVHIADVSFYVKPGTALDEEAAKRATTTYLVQRAYPMLPALLSENLCRCVVGSCHCYGLLFLFCICLTTTVFFFFFFLGSLNCNKDRLAFSVIFELTEDAQVVSQWFGRTVIRSCGKLSYLHAQAVIENPEVDWNQPGPQVPAIFCGQQPADVKADILQLHNLAQQMRRRRFESGALRLNKSRLAFVFDESGSPIDCYPYITKEANFLVEEFMLKANMAVAEKIGAAFPHSAMLRRHPPPLERKLEEVQAVGGKILLRGNIERGRWSDDVSLKFKLHTALRGPGRRRGHIIFPGSAKIHRRLPTHSRAGSGKSHVTESNGVGLKTVNLMCPLLPYIRRASWSICLRAQCKMPCTFLWATPPWMRTSVDTTRCACRFIPTLPLRSAATPMWWCIGSWKLL